MQIDAPFVIVVLVSFFVGAIPFGVVVSRLRGVDIRNTGSGNIGATNVWRSVGPIYGLSVFLLDGLKGLVGIVVADFVSPDYVPLAMALGVAGHLFSPFLGFKGGKGVSTIFVSLLLLDHTKAIVFAVIWVAVTIVTRYVSLASIIGMCYILCYSIQQAFASGGNYVAEYLYIAEAFVSFLSIVMHGGNITRLITGKEPKAWGGKGKNGGNGGFKKPSPASVKRKSRSSGL